MLRAVPVRWPPANPYVLALAATAVCLLLRAVLNPVLGGQAPFITFYVSVIVSAYCLGRGPAVLSAISGAVLAIWCFVVPAGTGATASTAIAVWLGLYVLVCATVIWLAHRQRRSERLAAQRYQDLLAETAARQQAERETERERRWAQVTLASIGDGVISTDAKGIVRFINPVAGRMTGWTPDEAVGRHVREIFNILNGKTREPARNPVDEVLATGLAAALAHDTVLITREGREYPIDDSAAAILDDNGTPLGAVLVFRDISERRRQEDELRRSNEDLKRFAYVASHDLQQPLRMVAGFVGLLRARYAGRLDEQADRYIQTAVDGAQRMQNLVRDLLEYSQAGTQTPRLVDTDLNAVINNVQSMLREQISACGASIVCGDLPVIRADELKIMQVFQNLIGNSLKFRGPDPPLIHITVELRHEEWLIAVRDNGAGFDPGYSEKIFGMFERLESPAGESGNGIGLAICKRVVEMHGGRIWSESRPGRGATFFFTLPVCAANNRTQSADAS